MRSCRDKFDKAKNLVASLPVIRPSPSFWGKKKVTYINIIKLNENENGKEKKKKKNDGVPESA